MTRGIVFGVMLGFAASLPAESEPLAIGRPAPDWSSLPGTDGKMHARADFDEMPLLAVIFFDNHCPDCQLYRDRILELAKQFQPRGVGFVLVSVSLAEEDNLDAMRKLAEEHAFPFPYIKDQSQALGRSFGAMNTPEVFVLDSKRRLAYHGAIDDHFRPAKVKTKYVADALSALLEGKKPPVAETEAIGCSIEYQSNP